MTLFSQVRPGRKPHGLLLVPTSMFITGLIPLVLALPLVVADTEILNFRSAKFAANCHPRIHWPVLSRSNDSLILTTIPTSSRRIDRQFPGEQSNGLCKRLTYDGNDGKRPNSNRANARNVENVGNVGEGNGANVENGGSDNRNENKGWKKSQVIDDDDNGNDNETLCEGDTWILLDLDQWFMDTDQDVNAPQDKSFTLRISWPASTPADFKVTLFQPGSSSREPSDRINRPDVPPRAKGEMVDIEAKRAQQARERDREAQANQASNTIANCMPVKHCIYARVRSSTAKFRRSPDPDGSIIPFQFSFLPRWFLAPLVAPTQGSSPSTSSSGSSASDPSAKMEDDEIRFHIILEPLVLGAIPLSLIQGTAGFLCLLVILAVFVIPRVNSGFERLAARVRKGKGRVKVE